MTTDQSNESPGSTPESNRSKIADPLPWIMMVLALSLDQLTKWVVVENLAVGESWPAMGLFRFTHTWNTGTAFSLFQGAGDILTWVSFGAVGVLTWIYRSIDDPPWVLRIAFGLQFGGAIGNIADRIRLGHVIDFIDVGWWPVFNIADSSIVIGIGLMIFYFWFLDESSKSDDPIDEVTTETAGPTVASTSLDSPE
ncbi:MAG TPA: signal peptidase II [Dehalococcoidia bacterium]|nr:signal peptidase II [Dehalococcoidia bacterium]MDP7261576.1 signal peptidase II [Dehalococcoidia bacterium]HJP28112.1 signal peptidase II [Dehalococcoidia bacterium]